MVNIIVIITYHHHHHQHHHHRVCLLHHHNWLIAEASSQCRGHRSTDQVTRECAHPRPCLCMIKPRAVEV